MIRKALIVMLSLVALSSGLLIVPSFYFSRWVSRPNWRTSTNPDGSLIGLLYGYLVDRGELHIGWWGEATDIPPPKRTTVTFAGFQYSNAWWSEQVEIGSTVTGEPLTSKVYWFTPYVVIPLVTTFLLFAVYPVVAFIRGPLRRWRRRRRVGFCDDCGYNLTGNESGRCPECGTEVEK